MQVCSAVVICVLSCVFTLSGVVQTTSAESAAKNVSGTLNVDGKKVALEYAYVDETDADEPIVVLSDKPLAGEAIPFLPEKLVKEKKVHAVAFSISRKDKKLTNTYGKVYYPGHELGVGLGRIEDGNTKLTIKRLDNSIIEGKIATTKTVKFSDVAYSFDLTFKVDSGKKKN
jgi:hypothetical protein